MIGSFQNKNEQSIIFIIFPLCKIKTESWNQTPVESSFSKYKILLSQIKPFKRAVSEKKELIHGYHKNLKIFKAATLSWFWLRRFLFECNFVFSIWKLLVCSYLNWTISKEGFYHVSKTKNIYRNNHWSIKKYYYFCSGFSLQHVHIQKLFAFESSKSTETIALKILDLTSNANNLL